MVSEAMVVQEENRDTRSDATMPSNGNITSMTKDIQSKEQFNSGDDFALKVRKPYTITKQRERWTEEEHKKFLEALKLFGRAWRKIEEHVGTKTAVQIRSHAQKFFSKVVRETNVGDDTSVKPIEIPPPRPKRKPMHPYPRKLVSSQIKTRISISEKPNGPASPNLCISEHENQSPTSVLSAMCSDASIGHETCMPNGSPSPFSSDLAPNTDNEDENTSRDEQKSAQNLDLVKEDSTSNKSTSQSLKLFGKTFSVTDTNMGPSYSTCKAESIDDGSEQSCLFPWRVVPLKYHAIEVKGDLFYTQLMSDKSNTMDTSCLPWLTLSSSRPSCDKEEQKEGSTTGSNSDLGSSSKVVEGVNKRRGAFSSYKLSKKNSANSVDCKKGFVPYKRCLAEQNSTISSNETTNEREEQRTRLCF